MKNRMSKTKLSKLIINSLEGNISPEEFILLETILTQDPDARGYYNNFLNIHATLRKDGNMFSEYLSQESDPEFDLELWQALAENEKVAPEIETAPEPAQEIVEVLAKPEKTVYKISKPILCIAILSTAAMLIVGVIAFLNPVVPIAGVLTDSINAEWINKGTKPVIGNVLREGEMILIGGCAEITLQHGAVITVEAPAKIELDGENSMSVLSGKISAKVSEYATGFTVNTPTARIVDLGTEFGVSVEGDGSSTVYMFTGKANMFTSKPEEKITSQIITSQQARSVDFHSSKITPVPWQKYEFIRDIDSAIGFIWNGKDIDMADIVGGGNGFGTASHNHVIDPTNGRIIPYISRSSTLRSAEKKFSPVQTLDFINGVFIPDGSEKPVIVSSEGHIFQECPVTRGVARKDIATQNSIYEEQHSKLYMANIDYGTKEHPAISMHANMGITFDLNSIRASIPADLQIKRFKAHCGIADIDGPEQVNYKAAFWILVDGKLMDSDPDMRFGKIHSIDIPISQDSRFLTLITTDGGDDVMCDRCIFAEPVLVLEPDYYTK